MMTTPLTHAFDRRLKTRLPNWLRRLLPTHIRTYYRTWRLDITAVYVIGTQTSGNGEYFVIGRFGCIEDGIRLARGKVERLEGEEVWETEAPEKVN